MKKKTVSMIFAGLTAISGILPHAPKIIPEGTSLIAAAAIAATLSIPSKSVAAIMPARIVQIAVTMPQSCEAGVMEQLCSSVTSFLNDEAAKTDADLKACKKNCGWRKRKDDLVDAARKKAKESCSKGEAPDVNELSKGLDRNTKDRLKDLYNRNSRMFDGTAKLASKDFDVKSNQSPALTGKGGQVADLKTSEPVTPKLNTASEFSLSGTKLSGETPGQAATKQSSSLLASASSAKSPADTAASAKTAVLAQKVSAAGKTEPFDWPTVPCNCSCVPNILGYSVKDCVTRCNILCGEGEECSAGHVMTPSGCCLASQVTTTGICCPPGQTPAEDGTCGCTAGKVTIVGPTDLFLFKRFSFLFISYPRSPEVPFKITTTKPPSKILWWASNEKVKFTSGTDQPSVEVIPTAESESVGDVTINVAVDNCSPVPLPLTVRRPKSLSHPPLKSELSYHTKGAGIGIGVGIVGEDGEFPWTLKDQLDKPMPNTLVKEEVKKKWSGSSIWALWPPWPGYKIESEEKTDAVGQIGDTYNIQAYFPHKSFYKNFRFRLKQKLIINDYVGFSDIEITTMSITGTSPVELK